MSNPLMFSIVFSVVGGLGIFLLGMKFMSDGLQTIAGDRLRKLIGMVTNNRIMATGVGTFVTCIIQSSSITTVLVVGFVNSGLMTLRQAIGVIMGANIGTTITGWILVLNVGKYGLPMLGVAAFAFLFSKNEKIRYIGMATMGIGMVFFGLELMKDGFKPIRGIPEFEQWFHMFSADSYFGVLKCAGVGCLLTLIVQSSSATLGVTMGLASTGVIQFETAAALVLGENIGTTITAFLASLGTTTNARRAAYAHIIFNVLGVLWITALFPVYLVGVRKFLGFDPDAVLMVNGVETFPHVQAGIAAVHTGFNVMNTLLFMPLVPMMAKLLLRIVPEKQYSEQTHLTHLDGLMLDSPVMAIEQASKEIGIMAEKNRMMLDHLKTVLATAKPDKELVQKMFLHEEELDIMQKEIMEFLTELLSANVPLSVSSEAQNQTRFADEFESLSDYLTTILKLHLRLSNADIVLSDEMQKEILELHDMVSDYFNLVTNAVKVKQDSILLHAYPQGDAITHRFREFRSNLMKRLSNTKMDPLLSTTFADMLNSYRRVKDHLLNIAEVVGGEK
jgi:phosphate:Na+ symporter